MLEKKQAEEAKYAYTPREGFNWDNVAVAFDEVLWKYAKLTILFKS